MLTNVHKCEIVEEKRCVYNGGIRYTDMVGYFDGFWVVYYNQKSIANILSLAHVIRTRQVVFDSNGGNIFKVYSGKRKVVIFKPSVKDPYYWYSKLGYDTELVMLNTISEKEKRYYKKEVKQTKASNRLSELLGYPSESDIESAITHNLINDCHMTVDDYRRALDIYGVDLGIGKGGTVR